MSTIEERVKKIVAEQLGVKEEEVTNSASFVEDLGADSLDTVELVMALEEEFETEIPDEQAEKITTVQEAIDYINAHASQSCNRRISDQRKAALTRKGVRFFFSADAMVCRSGDIDQRRGTEQCRVDVSWLPGWAWLRRWARM